MSDRPTVQKPSNPQLWRTHGCVIRANYPVTETVEKTATTLVRKYLLEGHEIMEDRLIANVAADGDSCDAQFFTQALGSFRGDLRTGFFTLTREQFEFLKEIWK